VGTSGTVQTITTPTHMSSLIGTRVSLLDHKKRYLSANKHGLMVANKWKASSWEMFTVFHTKDGKMVFMTYHGYYLSADRRGQVSATRIIEQAWEEWTAEYHGDYCCFKSAHGKYLCSEKDGKVVADRDAPDGWEKFIVTDVAFHPPANNASAHFTQIFPHIFVGDKDAVSDTRFSVVIGLVKATPANAEVYSGKFVQDNNRDGKKLAKEFPVIVSLIDKCEQNGKDVLIHCRMGRSRSVTALVAFLMWKKNWGLKKAIGAIKSKRSIGIRPTKFIDYLKKWRKLTKNSAGNRRKLFDLHACKWHKTKV